MRFERELRQPILAPGQLRHVAVQIDSVVVTEAWPIRRPAVGRCGSVGRPATVESGDRPQRRRDASPQRFGPGLVPGEIQNQVFRQSRRIAQTVGEARRFSQARFAPESGSKA